MSYKTFRVVEVGADVGTDVQGTEIRVSQLGDLEVYIHKVVNDVFGQSNLVAAWGKGQWASFKEMPTPVSDFNISNHTPSVGLDLKVDNDGRLTIAAEK